MQNADLHHWLMDSDPAIRWQVMRDLLNAPEEEWQAERQRTLTEGWGADFLARQNPDGGWGEGVYVPKWTSTTYTLLTLCQIGIPPSCEAARRGAERVVSELLGASLDDGFRQKLEACDRCIVGMILRIAVYFGLRDERVDAIVENLLEEHMADGAWNCRRHRRPRPHHSSFHTTFNVLEGMREYLGADATFRRSDLEAAERDALEFMLQHCLFKSDKTGEIINPKFLRLAHPPRFQYDVLRGLSYFARADAHRDPRLQDALDLLYEREHEGRWTLDAVYSGKVFFHMESVGKPSRWITLRAMRVLKWWNEVTSDTRTPT